MENIDYTDNQIPAPRRRRPQTAHRQTGWALGLELRQLRAFALLVDTGSVSAAARALGVAQSTMSEGMASLERAIGTRLVVRRRGERGVRLTLAGEALLPHARNVLASLEDAHVAVAGVDQDIRASVEIIANESISTYLLPKALAEVRRQWPKLRFSVTVGMCPSIKDGLASSRYDLGLMLQGADWCVTRSTTLDEAERGTTILLADVPLAVFSTVDHPLVSQVSAAPLSRSELSSYTVFVSDSRGHFFELVRDYFKEAGLPEQRLESTGSVEAVKRSVMSEPRGLGVLPAYAVADEVRTRRFMVLAVQPGLPRICLEAMSYNTRTPAHPVVAAMLESLRHTVHGLSGFELPVVRKRRR